jgi:transglutaminase-like putative cysteine protease
LRITLLGLGATFLTAYGLHPTIDGEWWFWASALCSLAAVAGCTLGRLVGLPRPLVPLVGFLALVLAVTQLSARDTAVLGVFPGPGAVREYVHLMHRAFYFINVSVPPAPNTASLVALVAGGVGLVALLVDTCAVTYRASALAGLPLLALYGVPVAVVRDGVPWPYFAFGAVGWMALVLAEGNERVGSWGRTVRRAADEPRTGRLIGRRIGFAALSLAVLVPAFLPGIGDGVLDPGGSSSGTGGQVLTENPFVSLAASLGQPANAEVLDYSTTADAPGYITLVTLDKFDGTTWIPSSLKTSGHVGTHTLPPLSVSAAAGGNKTVTTQFHADGLKQSTWLPTPTPLISVEADPGWVYDDAHRIPWSPKKTLIAEQDWTATSLAELPTQAELENAPPVPADVRDAYLKLPTGINPDAKKIAEQQTKNATSDFDKAVLLQNYFNSNFVYDATYRSPKVDPLGAFLAARHGFCQQFASAFAVMARELGLPTRVVVGFLPGHANSLQPNNRDWTVFWRDAHAWPEVYFSGYGWIRFEPTPRTDNTGISQPPYTQGSVSSASGGSASVPFATGKDTKDSQTGGGKVSSSSGSGWWSPRHLLGRLPWAWFGGTLLVVLLLAMPGLLRRFLRRRRLARAAKGEPIDAALAAWQELEATCVDLGVAWPVSRTPRQTALELTPEVAHLAAPALTRLGIATERAQYARDPELTHGLDADVSTVRVALLERTSSGQRVRAEVLPRSVLRRLGAALADAMDRVEDLASARPWRRRN